MRSSFNSLRRIHGVLASKTLTLLKCFTSTSFDEAVNKLSKLSSPPTTDIKLELYGLYKQVKEGPCTGPRPGIFDLAGRAKYDAWLSVGTMTKDEAESKYIDIIRTLSKSEGTSGSESTLPESTSKVTITSINDLVFSSKRKNINTLSYKTIKVDMLDHICIVSLNRPDKRNAINMQLWHDLKSVFDDIQCDDSIRVVILTGEGKDFSSGMDLSVFADMQSILMKISCEGKRREALSRTIQYFQDVISQPEKCRVPVIAAVNGNCIGGALDLITACDIRYCTEDAVFCIRETDLAMVADIGTLQRLPKLVGDQQTRELAYTGRALSGNEAVAIGLALKTTPSQAALMELVKSQAATIASKSPLAIRGIKKSILFSRDHKVDDGLSQVKLWNSAFMYSEDLTEAFRATMTKTHPQFTDS